MKRNRIAIFSVTGLLLAILTVPMTTALKASVGGHYNDTLQQEALGNQAELRATRRALTRLNAQCATGEETAAVCRAYRIVQKECFARQQKYFQDTGCPSMNDMKRIAAVEQAIEAGEDVPTDQLSSPADPVRGAAGTAPSLKSLPKSDQLIVRTAIRVKYCSSKLPNALYILCRAYIGENQEAAAPTGLGNDLQRIRAARRSAQPTTLMDRIEMTVPVER